jgi:hypothetical protein
VSTSADTTVTRLEIEAERALLTQAVAELRAQLQGARRKPLHTSAATVVGSAIAGFVLAGGVGATLRLLGTRERRARQAREAGLRSLFRR